MEYSYACPLCFSNRNKPLSRDLFKCVNCKAVFNAGYSPAGYEENYFVDMYKDQYGKTYHQDYDNIYALSSFRLITILKLLHRKDLKNISLLDIGSAMGFFLKCARDMGIGDILGNEISVFASESSQKDFQINTVSSSFLDFEPGQDFDIITAWYFVEHSEDPVYVIKKIFSLLRPGGVFGLAVPSFFGPQYFYHRKLWIDAFPRDHRVEFSPSVINNILKKVGFKKVYVKPAGFHPERILSKNSIFFPVFTYLYRYFSKFTGFSDTIEVFAVK